MATALQIAPGVSGRARDTQEEQKQEAERLLGPLRAGGTEGSLQGEVRHDMI